MFLSGVAARLGAAASTEQIDEAIQGSLRSAFAFFGADGGGIGLFSEDCRTLHYRYGHFGPGSTDRHLHSDLLRSLPWWAAELRAGRPVVLRRGVLDLPPEAVAERATGKETGIRSNIGLPLAAGGEILGVFGANHHANDCDYPPQLVRQLEALASLYANALFRRRARERLQRAHALHQAVLASVPSEIVVVDRNGEIVIGNAAWQRSARRIGLPADLLGESNYFSLAKAGHERGLLDAGEAISGLRAVLAGERPKLRARYAFTPASGERLHFLVTVTPRASGDGFVLVHTDVTELERTKAALQESLREVRELKERLEAENVVLRQEIRHAHGFDEVVGTSPALARVLEQVQQVASTDAPVLLLGETGTGKDVVARAIHARSRRANRPLVTVNCAALPATLIESELFGYEKGAFTGALSRTLGRFEVADGGTLFLDEVGDLPLELQPKLLRVLQTGEFERLGSPRTLKGDVRVIAATNRDLEREVREGRFRADLYYRLAVFPLALPPLRERREDVPLLVWHFIQRRQAKLGRSVRRVPERLMRAFCAHDWPGNVRELENVIERALISTTGDTLAADPVLLRANAATAAVPGNGATLAEAERAHILAVLEQCGWKVTGRGNAAERLGLKRTTLQYRMQKLGIRRAAASSASARPTVTSLSRTGSRS
jgi:transcriptional regulator with GAF, ATPase, and Fis domain